MDPNACYAAVEMGNDRAEIGERADALVGWIEQGGSLPAALVERGLDHRGALYFLRLIRSVAERA
jgi:hypothetical protein